MFLHSLCSILFILIATNFLIAQQIPVERIWNRFTGEISTNQKTFNNPLNYEINTDGPLKFVSEEILFSYRSVHAYESRGSEILSEYNKILSIIKQISLNQNIEYKPVSSFIVGKMIVENRTETEIRSEAFSRQSNKKIRNSILKQFPGLNNSQTILIKFAKIEDEDLLDLIDNLKTSESIFLQHGIKPVHIEPNYVSYINYQPNDTYYTYQWGLIKTNAEAGWDIESGSHDIKIGVIDTGVDITHEDLIDNIDYQLGYDFVDIDTASYKGQLINGEDYIRKDSLPTDYNGHGTHCAGIIGAKGNNSKGISGVAPNISIVPLRAGFSIKSNNTENGVLETDDIINAIDYAVLNGIDILSMSFSSTSYSGIFAERVQNAYNNNVILIAAAGNYGMDLKSYPAAYPCVISVAATDQNSNKASFSNHGYWVDICAPGEGIYSTVPRSGGSLAFSSGYRYLSGTSMATPFVAGLAGLILSRNKEVTPEAVEYILKSTSELPNENAFYIGAGVINIHEALLMEIDNFPDIHANCSNITYDQIIRTDIDIYGSATGDSYKIEGGSGIYPESWTVLDSGARIMNGRLGTLRMSKMVSGKYTIRIITEKQGVSVEYRLIIRVVIDEFSKLGFPIKVPVTPDSYIERGYLLIDDLENDGKKEILVTSGRSIIFYEYNGLIKEGWPVVLPQYGAVLNEPCLFDINGDGFKEVFMLGLVSQKTFVYAFDHKGVTLSGWPRMVERNSLSSIEQSMSIDDLDGDKEYELIVYAADHSLPAIMVFNHEGVMKNGWPYYFETNFEGRSKPVIADIDNDGKKDIVITAMYNQDPNGHKNKIIAIDCDGKLKGNFSYNLNGWGWSLVGGDINNDGNIEFMSQEALLANNGTKLTWNLLNTYAYSQISLGNVLNGSELEVLFGNGDGKAYLTDCLGNTLKGWPIRKDQFTADGDHIIADVNGDGISEIIIMWVPNTVGSSGEKPGLNIYNLEGKMIEGFPKYNGVYYFNRILLDDLDDDGRSEIISYSVDDHELFVIDLGTKYNPHNREWPAFLHNNRHTNNYNTAAEYPVLYNIKNLIINEDEAFSLQISPGYLDFSNFYAAAKVDTAAIEIIISNNQMSIIPLPDWNGSSGVDLFINDNGIKDSCRFSLIVTPVNDPIGKFSLISLEDSAFIKIDELNIDDTLTFKWEIPENVDSDSLFYTITFSKELEFMNSDSLVNNFINYPVRYICDKLSIEKIKKANVQWTVNTTDYEDTLQAENTFSLILERLITTGIPSNAPPGEFSLLQLADSSVIMIDESSMADSITFMWTKSVDLDSDSLFYSLNFSGGLEFLNADSLINNYISYPVSCLNDYLSSKDTNYAVTEWTVFCTDNKDTTKASNSFSLEIKKVITSAVEELNIPKEIFLSQNYPNPFNPVTRIQFGLTGDTHISIKVYNSIGQLVSTLVDNYMQAGYHSIDFNGENISSGFYVYRMQADSFVKTYKMILIK